jgi:hypothetical protein
MVTLATTHPTLLDVTKRLDPNGKIDRIAELLSQNNQILEDGVWIEGNLPTGHRTTIRTGLPTPTWRKLYGGVQPTKSTTAQITDTCGMLEAYAEVDKALADLNGNTAAFRLSEDMAHIEGMNQEQAETTFYGNEASESEAFTGFLPRFDDTAATNGENILQAGTISGNDNASIWLIIWGPNTCHFIYPKGSVGGLQMSNKGQVTVENATEFGGGAAVGGGRYEAYRTHYRWDSGLTVRDWRFVVRLQYEQATLVPDAATGPDLIDQMSVMLDLPPNLSSGRPAFYANRRALSFLKRQVVNKVVNSTLTMEMVGGRPVTMFSGVPVRRCDALTDTEAPAS